MAENGEFKPADNCKLPNQCMILEECFEGSVIRQEIRYEQQEPGSGRVVYQVENSSCEHPQAVTARTEAQPYLDES